MPHIVLGIGPWESLVDSTIFSCYLRVGAVPAFSTGEAVGSPLPKEHIPVSLLKLNDCLVHLVESKLEGLKIGCHPDDISVESGDLEFVVAEIVPHLVLISFLINLPCDAVDINIGSQLDKFAIKELQLIHEASLHNLRLISDDILHLLLEDLLIRDELLQVILADLVRCQLSNVLSTNLIFQDFPDSINTLLQRQSCIF